MRKKTPEKAKNEVEILKKFITESGSDLKLILSKYENEFFIDGKNKKTIFEEVLKDEPSEEALEYLESRLNSKALDHARDVRTPAEYGKNLIFSWLKEDVTLVEFENAGLQISLDGIDKNREFLSKKIKSNSDFLVTSGNKVRKIELVYDRGQFFRKNNRCDLRDSKFDRIKEEKGIIFGISLIDSQAFYVDLNDDNISIQTSFNPLWNKSVCSILNVREKLGPWREKILEVKSII